MGFVDLMHLVVDPGYCVGCGVCISACMQQALTVECTRIGQYQPKLTVSERCNSCGACLRVCPFIDKNESIDAISDRKFSEIRDIKYKQPVGYYADCSIGCADESTRLNSASGGALSLVLKCLLISKEVDKIITVESLEDSSKLFGYTIIENVNDIDRCSKSAYYPVELSEVLKCVVESNCRYALVGLPCVIKAVELVKRVMPRKYNCIKFVFGLVCGQAKSKKYTDFLLWNMNISLGEVKSVCYRRKISNELSSNFAFEVKLKDGTIRKWLWNDGINSIWTSGFFKQRSCYYCDDVFAECADAAFMDAWLPDYVRDYRGASIVLSRNEKVSNILKSEGRFEHCLVEDVIRSQAEVVSTKRGLISVKKSGLASPKKRIHLLKESESTWLIKHLFQNSDYTTSLDYSSGWENKIQNKLKYFKFCIFIKRRVEKVAIKFRRFKR